MQTSPDQTERRSSDPDDAFTASIAAMVGRYADKPEKLRAVLNGLALDGTLRRCRLPAGLAPMMRLPGPEPERRVRARMAELIQCCIAASGGITRDELLGGFTAAQIDRHAAAAARIAGVADMAA